MMKRALLQALLMPLPWAIRRPLLVWLFGFEIAPTARIGRSFVLAKRCRLGHRAHVGHFTMVKGLEVLELGDFGRLGNFNWVSGFPLSNSRHFVAETARLPSLIIGEHAAVTHRHIIDCTDRVSVGRYSTVGGFRSQILTHSIDLRSNRQSCNPTTVGEFCFVGTATVLLKGSVLPDRSVLGAASVLTKAMTEPGMLYSGVPAVPVRKMDAAADYFVREVGYVD